MEQVESIPFSSLLAGMLILKRGYTAIEIVSKLSELEGMGIVVDDENDDLEILSCCLEMDSNLGFHLKAGLEYDTVLCPDVTVFDFLNIHTNEKVMSFLRGEMKNISFPMMGESQVSTSVYGEENCDFLEMRKEVVLPKKRVKTFPFQRRSAKINCGAIYG